MKPSTHSSLFRCRVPRFPHPIRKIDSQPDDQPDDKPKVGDGGEGDDQVEAEGDGQEGDQRDEGAAERPLQVRAFPAENDDTR